MIDLLFRFALLFLCFLRSFSFLGVTVLWNGACRVYRGMIYSSDLDIIFMFCVKFLPVSNALEQPK